jgi:hypothetical protein
MDHRDPETQRRNSVMTDIIGTALKRFCGKDS